MRLVGGGFDRFTELSNKIDALIEAVDPYDEAAVDRTVAEIRTLYNRFPWVPWAFRQVLAGKNHLPANKLRLSILRQNTGFLGSGPFRQHFFGDSSMADVVRFFMSETLKYSTTAIELQKQRGFRRRMASRRI